MWLFADHTLTALYIHFDKYQLWPLVLSEKIALLCVTFVDRSGPVEASFTRGESRTRPG